ncbi:MAG: hypothetical protein F4057_11355 [Acidobacteria bacterium]|nr:hypothetical protein [Acidobacteriota bacterium]MYI75868.1 hypothetical protein [Acidobacteriota bacterium]
MMVAILVAAGAAACSDRIAAPAAGPHGGAAAPRGAPADTVDGADLGVRLDALAAPRPQRAAGSRNPFRFAGAVGANAPAVEDHAEGAATVAPPGGQTVRQGLQAATAGGGAVRRSLRFIAVVDAPQSAGLIAVLSDGETVFHGRVGDTIDGRYRIMSIGTDTAELVFLRTGERQVLHRDGA